MLDSTTVFITQQVQDILGQLAQAFGTTVEYLWPIMVKAAFARAIGELVVALVLWAVTIVMYHGYIKNVKSIPLSGNSYDPSCWEVTHITINVVMLVVSVIYSIVSWPGIVIGLFAPEYKALETILSALR